MAEAETKEIKLIMLLTAIEYKGSSAVAIDCHAVDEDSDCCDDLKGAAVDSRALAFYKRLFVVN